MGSPCEQGRKSIVYESFDDKAKEVKKGVGKITHTMMQIGTQSRQKKKHRQLKESERGKGENGEKRLRRGKKLACEQGGKTNTTHVIAR